MIKFIKSRKILLFLPLVVLFFYMFLWMFFNYQRKEINNPDPNNIHIIQNISINMGGDFSLIDHKGNKRSFFEFNGKPSLLYFGFTHCPDYCPSALQNFDIVNKILGKNKLNRIFISVDPKRDTKEVLESYVSLYDEGLIAMAGTKDQIADVTKRWKVFFSYNKRDENDEDYSVDHITYYFLTDKNGNISAIIKPDARPKDIAHFIKNNLI